MRLVALALLLSHAGAALAQEPLRYTEPVYTERMNREDTTYRGQGPTFTKPEQKTKTPEKPLRFSGLPFKRLKPCKNRNDFFGDRCAIPEAVASPSSEFWHGIQPIIW